MARNLRHTPFLPILNAIYYWSNNPVVQDGGCCCLLVKYAITLLCTSFSVIVWCMLQVYRFRVRGMVVKCTFVIWKYLCRTKWCLCWLCGASVRIVPEIMRGGGRNHNHRHCIYCIN
jgi:hypothetical protein